ncbi:sodium:solute symporter family transporter [Deinococcus cavernae]|uniref:sodium:solute symporter family transporter n=1 Tax=Deinococcus cavernae TaxID=2320857 RepID=UPI0023686F52|nr:hypothetical protein [Deinococcus cavernae]
MIVYVVVGGMLATTWVQIIKAGLLMFATIVMTVLILSRFGWSFSTLLGAAERANGPEFLGAGLKYKDPIDLISLCLALVLGTAGLPHILVRFFTVPTAQDARKSVVWPCSDRAFYVMTAFMGNAANVLLGKEAIIAANPAATWPPPCWPRRCSAARAPSAANWAWPS